MLNLTKGYSLPEWVPSVESFIFILQRCRKEKILEYAKQAHFVVSSKGIQADNNVGNFIVPMFVECGSLSDAQQTFNSLIYRSEHSWTSLVLAYMESGQLQHTLDLYDKMQEDNVYPSSYTLTALLGACTKLNDIDKGRQIHVQISGKRFERDLFVGSTLIDMYAKCGLQQEAREVFDNMPVRNVVSWNALIGGYIENGLNQEALNCFEQMQQEGMSQDPVTFIWGLKACGILGALDKGRQIHMEVVKRGHERDLFVGSTLVDMYAKCGSLVEAHKVFDKLQTRNVVSWTALIAGYAEHGPGEKALKCFEEMQQQGFSPDAITLLCSLKACGSMGNIRKGREIHAELMKAGLAKDLIISNSLLDMYIKCGSLAEAEEVFDKIPARDIVSWNSLISGYVENGCSQEALKCFGQMPRGCISPNSITFVCSLKACGTTRDIDKGRQLHSDVAREGLERSLPMGNMLIDMYVKCNSLLEARETFNKMQVRDVISWTTIIEGYAESGQGQKALECFEQMQVDGVPPNAVTFTCTLKACANVGAIDRGQEIHYMIAQTGYETDLVIGNTLIDMYAKCGMLSEACEIFEKLPVRDIIAWNAILGGYSMSHKVLLAIQCFSEMQKENVAPNDITFTCLLTACSRAGLVLTGQNYFKMMVTEYGISPTVDHHTCMVDLFARSGRLYEAANLLESAWCRLPKETWIALLSACKIYGDSELGLRCFQNLVQRDPGHAAGYVLMSNLYAALGRWEDANSIEELRKCSGARKKPATALIEINKKVHEFTVGDNQIEEVTTLLENMTLNMKEKGYVPNLDFVLWHIPDERKESTLCGHAERLAIAYGLLHTPQGQSLRVSKNLRMCNDCHSATKIISAIEMRRIIVRESNWVHYFKDGWCSCGDMW